MKITIEHHELKHSTEMPEDTNTFELVQQIKGLLVAAGHSPQNIDDAFYESGQLVYGREEE